MQIVDIHYARLRMRTLRSLGVKRRVVKLFSGEQLELRTNDLLAGRLLAEKWFEPAVRDVIRKNVIPGSTFLDIGANIGYYAVQAATLAGPGGRVLAFEPEPTVRAELEKNVLLNGFANVSVLPYALSDSSRFQKFCVPVAGEESMGSFRVNDGIHVEREIEVDTRRLDDLDDLIRSGPVTLMKVDAEGAELSIVQGAKKLLSRPSRPSLVFECREASCAAFGYRVCDLLRTLWELDYRMLQLDHENWFASPAEQQMNRSMLL